MTSIKESLQRIAYLQTVKSWLSLRLTPKSGENLTALRDLIWNSPVYKSRSQRSATKNISYQKPYQPVTSETIAWWLRLVLEKAGIDTTVFRAHSTRAASTSTAINAKVSVKTIMNAAGWSNALMFSKFYDKPIIWERGSSSENLGYN